MYFTQMNSHTQQSISNTQILSWKSWLLKPGSVSCDSCAASTFTRATGVREYIVCRWKNCSSRSKTYRHYILYSLRSWDLFEYFRYESQFSTAIRNLSFVCHWHLHSVDSVSSRWLLCRSFRLQILHFWLNITSKRWNVQWFDKVESLERIASSLIRHTIKNSGCNMSVLGLAK